jgi:GLPGLI family protein
MAGSFFIKKYEMKRKGSLLAFLLMTAANISFAQETVSLNVVYELRYIRDLTQKDNPYVSNMVLSIGKNTSRYCTEREFKESAGGSEARKKQQQELKSAKPMITVSGGPLLQVGRSGVAIREEIMKNIRKGEVEITGFIGSRTYMVETALPKINWLLQPEKKVIGKDTCQRALGSYAGREYEAWFAPDLPFNDGPWKLNGLPGLILEARDTSNEVIFTFKGISRNDDTGETVVSLLKDQFTVKTNLKSYNRSRESYEEDPEAIILAEHPDANIHIISVDGSGTKKARKIRKYNPIEKSD